MRKFQFLCKFGKEAHCFIGRFAQVEKFYMTAGCDGRDNSNLLVTFENFCHFWALWAFLCTLGTFGKRRQRLQQSFASSIAEEKHCSGVESLENRKIKNCFYNQIETNSAPLSHTWIYYDIAGNIRRR